MMTNIGEIFLSKLNEVAREKQGKVTSFHLAEIIGAFMKMFKAYVNDDQHVNLYNDLAVVEKQLQQLYISIQQLKPHKLLIKDLPKASSELAEIIAATENATNNILDAVEQIQNVASSLEDKEASKMIIDNVTTIMESCNFQDLSGQRVNKVTKILKNNEKFLHAILDNFSIPKNEDELKDENEYTEQEKKKGKHLLNGPQSKGSAHDQQAIDDLFNS